MFKAASFIGLAADSSSCPARLSPSRQLVFLGQCRLGACESDPVAHAKKPFNITSTIKLLYEAGNSAEWLRQHGKGLFPFFQ